jgi:hypothetical protein
MALNWWEYYEIQHKVENLKKEIEDLKKEVKDLRNQQKKKSFWGRFAMRE